MKRIVTGNRIHAKQINLLHILKYCQLNLVNEYNWVLLYLGNSWYFHHSYHIRFIWLLQIWEMFASSISILFWFVLFSVVKNNELDFWKRKNVSKCIIKAFNLTCKMLFCILLNYISLLTINFWHPTDGTALVVLKW